MSILQNFYNFRVISTKVCVGLSARQFSLNCISMKINSTKQEGKMMNKLLGTSKKKRKFYFENSVPNAEGSKMNNHGGKENSRRLAVLNTVFMKHISDLMMNGNMAADVLDKNFEISRVSMAPAFNYLNVFWATNSEENAAALEEVLPSVAFSLRHELSQLRVIGIVPRICFVRDRQLQNALKVDHLLSIADYGPDHEPLTVGSVFKNGSDIEETVVIGKPESSHEESNEGQVQEETSAGETMPVMRHDIFNLDHELIMNKITKLMKKSRAAHRFQPNLAVDCEGVTSLDDPLSVDAMTKEERQAAISNFILRRKVILEKRNQNKYNSELNVLPEKVSDHDDELEDYLEEDDFEDDKQLKH